MYICLQVLDGRIYEQVKDYLVSLCQTELESYQAVHNTFNQLLNSSNGVSLQTYWTTSTSLLYPSHLSICYNQVRSNTFILLNAQLPSFRSRLNLKMREEKEMFVPKMLSIFSKNKYIHSRRRVY